MKKTDLAKILSSEARFRVLEAVCKHVHPLPLRHIEVLSGLAIRSVQVAVEGLVRDNVLVREKRGRFVLFAYNKRHSEGELIQRIFSLIQSERLEARATGYGKRARSVLKFSSEVGELIGGARSI